MPNFRLSKCEWTTARRRTQAQASASATYRWECCVSMLNHQPFSLTCFSCCGLVKLSVHCRASQTDKPFQLGQRSGVWTVGGSRGTQRKPKEDMQSPKESTPRPSGCADRDVTMHRFPLNFRVKLTFPCGWFQRTAFVEYLLSQLPSSSATELLLTDVLARRQFQLQLFTANGRKWFCSQVKT